MNGVLKVAAAAIVAAGFAGPALAMGTNQPTGKTATQGADQGYTKAEKAVKAKEYRRAIAMLKKIVARNPKHVDALNYLGYSYRQLGDYRRSLVYYKEALSINPNHRGANEYLGRLYILQGNMAAAKRQLAKLRQLCPKGCEEYDSLSAAVASASKRS